MKIDVIDCFDCPFWGVFYCFLRRYVPEAKRCPLKDGPVQVLRKGWNDK